MWRILQAELTYLKFGIFPLLIFVMGAITFYTLMDVVVLNRATLLFGIIVNAQIIGFRNTERRSVKEMIMPVSINQIAIARILLVIIPPTTIYLAAIIFNLLLFGYDTSWNDSILELISICMLTILFSFIYYFFSDIFSIFKSIRGKFVSNIIFTVLLTAGAIFTIITVEKSFSENLQSGLLLLFIISLAIFVFALFSIYTLQQKESHIN